MLKFRADLVSNPLIMMLNENHTFQFALQLPSFHRFSVIIDCSVHSNRWRRETYCNNFMIPKGLIGLEAKPHTRQTASVAEKSFQKVKQRKKI
jgi:hypothetical protein